jgi:hypothetical protein
MSASVYRGLCGCNLMPRADHAFIPGKGVGDDTRALSSNNGIDPVKTPVTSVRRPRRAPALTANSRENLSETIAPWLGPGADENSDYPELG